MLTLLHTSDWHLGRRLYGKPRYHEFKQFLDWQLQVIDEQSVDVLLIAGDIFDTTTPSNQAQSLYYDFLGKVPFTGCRHVVIVAGNHDSPTFLDAPKQLLKSLNIHIIGSMPDNLDDEVITLLDQTGNPELIIMAVPYLRDRDVRTVASGELLDDKERKLTQGIQTHYQNVTELALQKQAEIQSKYARQVPIVATGHLFTVGGKTEEGDGVRELYVGSLGSIGAEIFHPQINYVALGHLHIPQTVGGQAHIRYSGSPIAMGFGECGQQKQVHLVRFLADENLLNQPFEELRKNRSLDTSAIQTKKQTSLLSHQTMSLFADEFDDELDNQQQTSSTQATLAINEPKTTQNPDFKSLLSELFYQPYNLAKLNDTTVLQSLCVPIFQSLQTVKGDWSTIKSTLQGLKKSNHSIWLDIVYDGQAIMGDLTEQINEILKNSQVEALRIKNLQQRQQIIESQRVDEMLEELDAKQVFERCLQANNVLNEQKPMLWARYAEVLESLQEAEK